MSDDEDDDIADPVDDADLPDRTRRADCADCVNANADGGEPECRRFKQVGDDPFGPPVEPCECYCLHCRRTFMSSGIWFQRIRNARAGQLKGFWMCPTPNCDGKGFTFDLFPTDPNHPANDGWSYDDDDDPDAADDELDVWTDDVDNEDAAYVPSAESDPPEYDPAETKWKQLDDEYGDTDDDDIEGEEWKYGLQPGERLPEPQWLQDSRREWEEEQRRYDAPDKRPREIEWEEPEPSQGGEFKEDDIPF